MEYPTKNEILKDLYRPSQVEEMAVNLWKEKHYTKKWSSASKAQKLEHLEILIGTLSILNGAPLPLNPNLGFKRGDHWAYFREEGLIMADPENPSIVSALHELGHHLFGVSELLACRYSVGVFSHCFPGAYNKLAWEGHMLVKPRHT